MTGSSLPLLPIAFRDTALTIATLNHDVKSSSFEELRQRCHDQIIRLRDELVAQGASEGIVDDATYAQCALLDEVALSHLDGKDRDAWEREPLQVSEFRTHHAGEELVERIRKRLAEPQPAKPLLAIFRAVLALGFRGRFARDGQEARTALVRALDERIGPFGESSEGVIIQSRVRQFRMARLSLLAWMLAAVAGVGTIYIVLDRWLSAAISQLMH